MRCRTRQIPLSFRTWGGRRAGAGRKPVNRRRAVPHRRRPLHHSAHPVHVTLRAVAALPSLRNARLFPELRRALAAGSKRTFRLAHFSVQTNHVHLLVEAEGPLALRRGMQGLGVRLAKAVNQLLGRRGAVWAEHYHARALRSPREVRRALVYVLHNGRKHGARIRGIDPCSSGAWFDGWKASATRPSGLVPVARARTWLLAVGWRRGGLIGIEEVSRGAGRRPSGFCHSQRTGAAEVTSAGSGLGSCRAGRPRYRLADVCFSSLSSRTEHSSVLAAGDPVARCLVEPAVRQVVRRRDEMDAHAVAPDDLSGRRSWQCECSAVCQAERQGQLLPIDLSMWRRLLLDECS